MRVNVIGSGYMGRQITAILSIIGFDILLWQKSDGNLTEEINKEIRKVEKILKLKSLGSVKIVNELHRLENNITIETVIENLEIKKKIFENLNYQENLFSNTSSIKLSSIGKNINGFHFMNPVTVKLIEICKIGNFSQDKLNFILNKLKKISYDVMDVVDSPGYMINKILFKDISFFFYLIEKENFRADEVKKIYLDNLKHSDPIKLVNLIGVDTCLHILINLNKYDNQYYIPKMLQDSVKLNILGNKNKTRFKVL
jgi:3-hydroxybutyryl-CoA dehydrogenase